MEQTGGPPIVRVIASDDNFNVGTYYLNLANMSHAEVQERDSGLSIQLLMLGMFPSTGNVAYGVRLRVSGEEAQKLREVLDRFDLLKPPPRMERRSPE